MKTLIYSVIATAALSFTIASAADVEVFVPTPNIGIVVGGHHRHHERHHDVIQVWVPAHYSYRHHHQVWVEGYYQVQN